MISRQNIECNREDMKKNKGRCVEILAPAGSYDSFRAALMAGADAVYAGGPHFGARAYAENFTEEQLLEAIDQAHLHGCRFYLTVNTLVKDKELPQLCSYLEPLYRGGLDAVIVQDTGVFEIVRSHFPEMDIHVSTQMTVTGAEGAEFLKKCGAVRVVPARELSLEEIRYMKQATGMEIECFVHGALCYCYSGQCLLSSLIGGRSGNRGQCAQPCRLRYTSGGEKGYLLSLKDICTLELIPDLVEAGIDSFKIEGRMKRPEYVAGVTSMYRKYVDLYRKAGRKKFQVSEKDKEMLLDLYNRGGFHTGYYQQRNGRDMIAVSRPNHAGVPAVKILGQKGREASANALVEIHKGDILTLPQQGDYTFGKDYGKGSMVTILLPKGTYLKKGSILYRTRNEKLLKELQDFWKLGKIQEKVYGFLRLISKEPATMTVCRGEVSVEAASELVVEKAEKTPLDEARIRKQLEKTGNTEFIFEKLEIEMEEGVFLPMQQINELRRRALEELRKRICTEFYRVQEDRGCEDIFCKKTEDTREKKFSDTSIYLKNVVSEKEERQKFLFSALVATMPQLEEVCAFPEVSRIYIDSFITDPAASDDFLADICSRLRAQGREVFLAVPHIFRKASIATWEKTMKGFFGIHFDGVLLRNYESSSFWMKSVEKARGSNGGRVTFDRNVILDHNLYVMNQAAKSFWNKQGVHEFTVPVELNQAEIRGLGAEHMEMLAYGYLPVMVTAQCVANTVDQCRKREGTRLLTDRYGNQFSVENRCRDCYNIIYNPVPLCLFDEKDTLRELRPSRLRLQFSVEDRERTRQVLRECMQVFMEGAELTWKSRSFTRGHFRRGVL